MPPNLLTGTGVGLCVCVFPMKDFFAPSLRSRGPGVEIPSYEIIAGQTNEDIQASVELWNFFNAHTLCNITIGIDELTIRPTIKIYPNPAQTELNISILERLNFFMTCKLDDDKFLREETKCMDYLDKNFLDNFSHKRYNMWIEKFKFE